MRQISRISLFMALIGTTACLAAQAQDERKKPESLEQKFSYGIGLNLGQSFKSDGLEVNLDALIQGIRDAMAGAEPLLNAAEVNEAMQALQADLRAKAEAKAEANVREGEEFLAKNEDKEGVTTTPSGLQYEILTAGTGASPASADTVSVHYRGTLLDGTQFDSSYDRGEPASFGVNQVIPGWTEALQLMKVGAKWSLFIPSALAYGPRGSPPIIGPNSVLQFQVELLEIISDPSSAPGVIQ